MTKWTIEQQKAIFEEGKNILVSAGAGSGKTAVLTERVLEKLKKGIHIDELLILTFTNAAAKEMKERIRLKIKEIPSLKEELSRVDSSYITTFDSFAFSIVKKYHYKLNLKKDMQVASSAFMENIKRQTLEEIFTEYYEVEDERFFKLLTTFTSKDDKSIKEMILLLNSKLEQIIDKKKFIENYEDHFFSEAYFQKITVDYTRLLKEVKTDILDDVKLLEVELRGDYIQKLEDMIVQILETHVPLRLPALPNGSSETIKKQKDKIKKKIDDYLSLCEEEEEERIDKYKKTKEFIRIVLEIILKLEERVIAFKKEKDIFEFIDIEKMAIELLDHNPALRMDLRDHFKEIMIDEYQDTNDIQEYFISLIANNNCYMVGDIKQSIYRFRNANPSIFKAKYEQFEEEKEGIKIDMNKNFRSREEVINDINLLFTHLMDFDLGGADYVSDHQMHFGNTDYTKFHPQSDYHMQFYTYQIDMVKKETKEARIIAQDILKKMQENYPIYDRNQNKTRSVTFSDFAILLDRTTSAEEYKKVFESYQIPLTILKDTSILDNVLLQVLANILHFLFAVIHKREFKFYFVSIARSFLYSYPDEEIFTFVTEKKMKETEIYQNILLLKERQKFLTPSMLLEEIVSLFEIEEKLYKIGNSKEHIKLLDSLYKLCSDLEQIGYTNEDLETFLEAIYKNGLDLKIPSPKGEGNSVSFMSIHKSKGLEFPICYFAGLTKTFNITDLNELFLYDKEYGILCPYEEEGIASTFVKRLLKEKYNKEEIGEKIRLFYVALTRVKEKMIFVCPSFSENTILKRKNARSFYDFLCILSPYLEPYVQEVKEENLKMEKKAKKEASIQEKIEVTEHFFEEKRQQKQTFSKRTYTLFSEEEKKKMTMGLEIHKAFEETDFFHPESSKYASYIEKFLKQDVVKNIKNAQIFKEYEFLYTEKEEKYHGIIDLMLVFEKEIVLIDYKLKEVEEEAYIKQIKGYQNYIQKKTGKPTQLYLYSILQDEMKKVS